MNIINQCALVMVNVLRERVMPLGNVFVHMAMKDLTVINYNEKSFT